MPRRLPPLRTLQVFEAAARHLHFSRAAAELALTQGAVSRQIRTLEAALNCKLFERTGRAMRLTSDGERLFVHVHSGLMTFADGVSELRRDSDAFAVNISATPSIAAGWLIPRLPDFYRRQPDVDINLRATNALIDFARDGIDLALRYGAGRWPGLCAEKLLSVDLFPVCGARYRRGRLPRTVSELLETTLLHYTYGTSWEEWFKSTGAKFPTPLRGPRFDDYVLAVQAAAGGQGILLGRDALVADELASGRLVRPLMDQPAQRVFDYFIVYPEAAELSPPVKLFHDWLLEQTAR